MIKYIFRLLSLTILLFAIWKTTFYIYENNYINQLILISVVTLTYIIFNDSKSNSITNSIKNASNLLDDLEINTIREDKITPILNIIKSQNVLKFFSLALIGKWGIGKSSYLKTLEKKLKNDYEVIYINVWELENSVNVINELKKEFDDILFEYSKILWIKKISTNLLYKDYFAIISKYFTKSEIKLSNGFEQKLQDSKNDYNNLLKKALNGKKVIVMIDEIDRIYEKEEILNIFKVIRYSTSFDNVFMITALDLEQIQTILKGKEIEYIHKIFNFKYHLPKPDKNDFMEFYIKIIMPKLNGISDSKEFEKFLTKQNYNSITIIDIIPTYRVIKNSFNDSYILIKSLEDNWKQFISFEFIYIVNLIKAISYNEYNYLVVENNLHKIVGYIKEHKSEELEKEPISENIVELVRFLVPQDILNELYLEIFKNSAIFEYNVSEEDYKSFLDDDGLIDDKLKSFHFKDYRTKFLLDLVFYIKNDIKNQNIILKKLIDLVIQNYKEIDYEELLETIIKEDLVNNNNKDLFISIIKNDNLNLIFMKLVFEYEKFMNIRVFIDKDILKEYLEIYLKYIEKQNTDKKELEKIFAIIFCNNLKIKNIEHNDKEYANDIRMIIFNTLKDDYKIEVQQFILNSLYFEDITQFIAKNNLKFEDLIDENIKYNVWIADSENSHITKTMLGKDIKKEIQK